MPRRPKLSDDDVAAILDGTACPSRVGSQYRVAAQALTSAVVPDEAYRARLKSVVLRTFERPADAPLSAWREARDLEPTAPAAPPLAFIVGDDARVDMVDLDELDPISSADAARALLRIAEQARERR